MRSNYKKLGPYIKQVNFRNSDLQIDLLLGVSIKKILMPSIANTVGTNMKTYKIIKKDQFAYGPVTSRNGDKISVALLEEYNQAIVSQAYTVFEITDLSELLPEYLMMWFRRPEFDRYTRFKSHGSARETFDWEEMCNIELPIPSLQKQQEIVYEYNTVVNRIKLNEELNQKLEETAQTLYKHWFVDFEFPVSKEYAEGIGKPEIEGKPYKSNGGEMVFNEDLNQEIPIGWQLIPIGGFTKEMKNGGTPNRGVEAYWESDDIPWLKSGEVVNSGIIINSEEFISENGFRNSSAKKLIQNTVLIALYGATAGQVGFLKFQCTTNQAVCAMTCENYSHSAYLYYYLLLNQGLIKNMANGGAQANISKNIVEQLPILEPNQYILKYDYWVKILNCREIYTRQIEKLSYLSDLILKKLSSVNKPVYEV